MRMTFHYQHGHSLLMRSYAQALDSPIPADGFFLDLSIDPDSFPRELSNLVSTCFVYLRMRSSAGVSVESTVQALLAMPETGLTAG